MLVETVTNILSLLTIAAQGFILFVFVSFFYNKSWLRKLKPKRLVLSFIVSATAVLGSLFFSEIAKYVPCKLCWFQRIFMYPLPLLILIALKNSDKKLIYCNLSVFSFIGLLIAGFHYYLQINPIEVLNCSAVGYSVSCSESFFMRYGYITIPMMSLTAFATIFVLSWNKLFK